MANPLIRETGGHLVNGASGHLVRTGNVRVTWTGDYSGLFSDGTKDLEYSGQFLGYSYWGPWSAVAGDISIVFTTLNRYFIGFKGAGITWASRWKLPLWEQDITYLPWELYSQASGSTIGDVVVIHI